MNFVGCKFAFKGWTSCCIKLKEQLKLCVKVVLCMYDNLVSRAHSFSDNVDPVSNAPYKITNRNQQIFILVWVFARFPVNNCFITCIEKVTAATNADSHCNYSQRCQFLMLTKEIVTYGNELHAWRANDDVLASNI